MTTLLLGFTFMVLNTGYTAVVTTRLMQASTTTVTNLDEAMSASYRICVNQDLVPALVARYPGLGALIVQNTVDGNLLDAIEADVCDAAIYEENSWRARRAFGVRQYCEHNVRLPEPIYELSNAIPVRGEIEQAISTAIQSDLEAGLYEKLEVEALHNYTYA